MKQLLFLLLAIYPATLLAQPVKFMQPVEFAQTPEELARGRRAARERAVAHAGADARGMTESEAYGDEAARAILNCTRDTATRLAEFHARGGFDRVPRKADLLALIGAHQSGDEIARWVMDHTEEFTDPDALAAFLTEPVGFVVAVRKLSTAAAELRASRIESKATPEKHPSAPPPAAAPSFPITRSHLEGLATLALVLAVPVFAWWWQRRRASGSLPA